MQETKGSLEELHNTVKNLEKEIVDFKNMERPMPVEDPEIGSQ
jgi:hypothetical protein